MVRAEISNEINRVVFNMVSYWEKEHKYRYVDNIRVALNRMADNY